LKKATSLNIGRLSRIAIPAEPGDAAKPVRRAGRREDEGWRNSYQAARTRRVHLTLDKHLND
jgi:hypothetical protein